LATFFFEKGTTRETLLRYYINRKYIKKKKKQKVKDKLYKPGAVELHPEAESQPRKKEGTNCTWVEKNYLLVR
jgi:hypothetical protein